MTSPRKNKAPLIITIDGPAGAGKSTTAQALARILKIAYLDTGAMYRALTLKALKTKTHLEDEKALADLAQKTTIDLQSTADGSLKIFLDGKDVTTDIRTLEVTNNTFYIARAPKVREIMVELQRTIGNRESIVAEGRDVGTVVFPHATFKFYLNADFEIRSKRRLRDLKAQGKEVEFEKLKKEIEERDQKDLSRSVGPLKKADDAIVIDSTLQTIDESAQEMLKIIKERTFI